MSPRFCQLFTDTGRYVIQFGPPPVDPEDPTPRQPSVIRDLTLDERAVRTTTYYILSSLVRAYD